MFYSDEETVRFPEIYILNHEQHSAPNRAALSCNMERRSSPAHSTREIHLRFNDITIAIVINCSYTKSPLDGSSY